MRDKLNIVHVEDNVGAQVAAEFSLIGSDVDYDLTRFVNHQAALEHLDEVDNGEQEPVDVLLVGGNPYTSHGKVAKQLVERVANMNAKKPLVIGLGTESLRRYGIEVDMDLTKNRVKDLGPTLCDLTLGQAS